MFYVRILLIKNQFKMKKITFLILFLVSVTVFSQENEMKSIHLFDLPNGISEQQYINDLEKLNSFFIEAGFGKNYFLYKVKDSKSIMKFKYFVVSTYENMEDYDKKHIISDEYDAFMENFNKVYSEMIASEIYRKVIKIN
tara:strand:+ start:77 stop:496 length:420 start_codon:yes stop_codon:yes gene_type:complete